MNKQELKAMLDISQFPKSAGYDTEWLCENEMGPCSVWLCEFLVKKWIYALGCECWIWDVERQ